MSEFLHGVHAINRNDGYIELRSKSTAVIATICTSSDADAEYFPLDRCTLVTNLDEAIKKSGTKGTLKEVLRGIQEEVNTNVIVVRVEEGETPETTTANVIGNINADDSRTGLKALELAGDTGLLPSIFVIPKFDADKSVAIALAEHAKKFAGFTYISASHCENIAEAIKYREEFAYDEMMLIYGDVITFNPDVKLPTETYAVAKIAGLRAKLDQEIGWHQSISNNALSNVQGLTKPVTYNPINGFGTEANTLNEKGITCLVRDDGYRVWGNRTCAAADSDKYFEVFTRSSQVVTFDCANLLKNMTQDKPMTRKLLKDFEARGVSYFEALTLANKILGGRIFLNPEKNSVDDLMSGKPAWSVKFTPTPPVESPEVEVMITEEYVKSVLGG